MGKISEALKKAGKADRSRLAVRRQSSAAPEPRPNPERPLRIPLADREDPGAANVAPTAERLEKVKKSAATTKPLTASVERVPEPVIPKKQATAEVAENPHPAHDSPNISMVRTSRSSQFASSVPLVAPETGRHETSVSDRVSGRPPIQISYSETRVQAMDPEKLKNNRIFSIFDDIETSNQIKILRTQVLKRLETIGGNSFLVTSANPHEGKTFTSINLGVSIAKVFNRTVLIIDADLRKPTKRHAAFSTDFFSIDVEFGLAEYLKGESDIRDILINPGIERLTLIPGGKPVDNAPELLNSRRMAEMMDEVKKRYGPERLVIVDGPAMLPFPDAMILSTYVDGVLPVVELEKTPADQLKRMIESLKDAQILGTVLNKNKG